MYLFALFLVLYEFTTYVANDMIMPGMIDVVHYFHAQAYYVAYSMNAYILGQCAFILIAGFLSERYGKRLILLWGNFLFLLFTILIIFSQTIHQFVLYRFLQGLGLSIIAIGYALIHQNFNDKDAIKLIALMGNISILAPLVGPAIGSIIVNYWSWPYVFIVTAVCALITLGGLYFFIPKEPVTKPTLNFSQVIRQYGCILINKEFFLGAMSASTIIMPLLIWISQAPNLILDKLQLNYFHYAIYQLISIGGLSLSSILMQFIAGKYSLYSIVKVSNSLIIVGLLIGLIGTHSIEWITSGLFIYALGMGLANGCIWRIVVTIKPFSHTTLSSMLVFVQALMFVIGIALTNEFMSHHHFELWSFSSTNFLFGLIGFILLSIYISAYRGREWV